MKIEPGDLFLKHDGSTWVVVEYRANNSWNIYCAATNIMKWEWDDFLRQTNNGFWKRLA